MARIDGTNSSETIDEVAIGGNIFEGNQIYGYGGGDLIIARTKSGLTRSDGMAVNVLDTIDGGSGIDTYRVNATGSWSATATSFDETRGGGGAWSVALTSVEQFDIIALTHGVANLGNRNDMIDASAATGTNGNYTTGGGNDVVKLARGAVTANLGAGSDRLVLVHDFNNARTNIGGGLMGSFAEGYSGSYNRSDGASTFATINFSGVEHFTIATGGGGDDIVTGNGDDIVSTGGGIDRIVVGRGNDVVDGGSEVDSLSIDLSDELSGVTIDLLAAGEQQSGGTGSIRGVESFEGAVIGSAYDDVLIEGNFSYNAQFSTGDGNDLVQISRGADDVNLGAGSDRLVLDHQYNNAFTNISSALMGSFAEGYSGSYNRSDGAFTYATVNFSGVEHFTILTAGGRDVIGTGDGNDIIATGAGDDIISVAKGDDRVDGGEGIDSLSIDLSDEATGVRIDLTGTGEQQAGGTGVIRGIESFTGAVIGSAFNDVFIEGVYDVNAQFSTGAGNDRVQVSRGSDTVDLGAGLDRLVIDHSYNNARTVLTVPVSGDLANGYAGTYYRSDGASVFSVIGFSGVENFTITTGDGADTLVTGDGDDVIVSGGGADSITVGRGNDSVNGGAGLDTLSIDLSDEVAGVRIDLTVAGQQQTGGSGSIKSVENFAGAVIGGSGNDVFIEGMEFADAQFSTGAGKDYVQVSTGTDTVDLGSGRDRLVLDHTYNNARTVLSVALSGDLATGYSGTYRRSDGSSAQANVAFTGVEDFTILTGGGTDTIQTGDGGDVIDTGGGDDTIIAARGVNRINGGDGIDALSIDFSDEAAGVVVDLTRSGVQQTIGAGTIANVETFFGAIVGTRFADTLVEGSYAFNATFDTGLGDDSVQVSRGADVVNLGGGNDRLVLDYSDTNAITYVTTALSGSLATGYSGEYYVGGGATRTTFSGVENFTIRTGNGGGTIQTGDGDDVVSSGGGADAITVGRGTNVVDGGGGIDALSIDFSDERSGVVVDLTRSGAQQTRGAGSIAQVESFFGAVIGTRGADTLIEGNYAFNATFDTGLGDDIVQVSTGSDVVNLGGGNDRLIIDYTHTSAFIFTTIALSGSLATGYSGEFYVQFGSSRTTFSGVENFTIRTGGNAETLVTGDGDDILDGGAGNDNLMAGGGADILYGGDGDDVLNGGAGIDNLYGGAGNDRYIVDSKSDRIFEDSDGGVDIVESSDTYRLGARIENLTLTGNAVVGSGNLLDNVLTGNAVGNVLRGGRGDDILYGMGGDDFLFGDAGADRMQGGIGDDTYGVDDLLDVVIELADEGLDTVRATIDYALADNFENLILFGGARVGTGNALANRLIGTAGDDRLSGLDGADLLIGGNGNDTIDGGAGNDVIFGDVGFDILTGGTGADLFRFRAGDTGRNANKSDEIRDFSRAEGDKIHLTEIDAVAGTDRNDAFTFIGSAAFSGTAGELRVEAFRGETYLSGDTDGDGAADLVIRFTGLVEIGREDFFNGSLAAGVGG